MKYAILYITVISLTASVAFAQQKDRSGNPGMREGRSAEGGGRPERMQRPGANPGEPGSERHGGRDMMMARMLNSPEMRERLGISEENAETIKAELEKIQAETQKLREKMQKLSMEQAKAWTSKDLDESKLMNLADELGKVRTDIGKTEIKKLLLLRKHMDPEKMDEIRRKVQSRMQSRAGKDGGSSENGERGRFRDRMTEEDKAKFEQMRQKRQSREKDAGNKPAESLRTM